MALPFFYQPRLEPSAKEFVLDEETSKHIVQVLRMQNGEQVQLTDGKGKLLTAGIIDHDRKSCGVKILSSSFQPPLAKNICIGISLIKNTHRFEWFLEKAAEIGISRIVPLLCARTEKQHFRIDRMHQILISAMLQSQQAWLPLLHEPVKYITYIKNHTEEEDQKKFIAHCVADGTKVKLTDHHPFASAMILIGPEGDFTGEEIELAVKRNFIPVALGDTRLRTETAGVVAAAVLSLT